MPDAAYADLAAHKAAIDAAITNVTTTRGITKTAHGQVERNVAETIWGHINDTDAHSTAAELAAHEADTTSVHGISNTALLALKTGSLQAYDTTTNLDGLGTNGSPVVFTTGLADTTDAGGGFWRRIGSGYTEGDVTLTTRYGLDHVTSDGYLYRRLETILTPEMWGAVNRSVSDTDQSTLMQRMFNLCCSIAWSPKNHIFFVPNGEYRIQSTLKLYNPQSDIVMHGVAWVPSTSRITAIRLKGTQYDLTSSGDTVSQVINTPIVRLACRKGRYTGSTEPYWMHPSGGNHYSFAVPFPSETVTPWTTNDTERELYIEELDCGVEILKSANRGSQVYQVDKAEFFCIGVRAKADSNDAEFTAGDIIGGGIFKIRGLRANKVGLMVCVRRSAASGSNAVYNNGNEYHLEGQINLTDEKRDDRPQYGIMLTSLWTGTATNYSPNGNRFFGGTTESWPRNSGGSSDDSCAILLDRGNYNIFDRFRIEQYDPYTAMAYNMPNPDPLVTGNNIFVHQLSDEISDPTHNCRNNPIYYIDSQASVNDGPRPWGLVSEFNPEQCMYSSASRIYLPRPWVRQRYFDLALSDPAASSPDMLLPYLEAGESSIDHGTLSTDQRADLIFTSTNARLGIIYKVSNLYHWNKIRLEQNVDTIKRLHLQAWDSNLALISVDYPYFAFWHGSSDFTLVTSGSNEYYYTGSALHNRADFSLRKAAGVAYLFIGLYNPSGSCQIDNLRIYAEGVELTPYDPFGSMFPNRLAAYPIAGYLFAGDEFMVGNFMRYRCTVAGYLTNGAWANGVAVIKNEYRTNGGRVYKADAAGTTGATPPTHSSGSVSDGAVSWTHVAAGSAATVVPVGYTSAAADPTTTELPKDKDWGIHKNTSSGSVYLAYNDATTIKKVALT